MNKIELVNALREETGVTRSEATEIVDLLFNEMSETLEKGDRVEIRGLFSKPQ